MALRVEDKHKSDIIAIDCSDKLIVTGHHDGQVGVWNIFSGQVKCFNQVQGKGDGGKKAAVLLI